MITHRVLLHNHSRWSDGRLSLREIVKLGERLGASAVVMSEHDFDFTPEKWEEYKEACRLHSARSCALIPGIEYSSPDDAIHIVTVGSQSYFGARRNLRDILSLVRAEGGASILAHPRRRRSFESMGPEILQHIDAIEIWNRKVDGVLPVRLFYKFAMAHSLAATVGMDFHTWRQFFPMWNMIVTDSSMLDAVAIATALRNRTIMPAWLMGNLGDSLDRDFSVKMGALAVAERLRLSLRDLRDTINMGDP